MDAYQIVALYKFVLLEDYEERQPALLALCRQHKISGTILLAKEGINGTIAGPPEGMKAVIDSLNADPVFQGISLKQSWAPENPFLRMKVRLKKEIVTLGVPTVDPRKTVGTYVKPKDWNALIERDDVQLIDTRNDYEIEIGTFKGAIDPKTKTFREFPEWVENAAQLKNKPPVAMFCTGGIRCEKATSYLLDLGFEEVYHLEGGILKYLEETPAEDSLWEGECFVFDNRVSVDHELNPGSYDMCHGCRCPISDDDKSSPDFILGVCCPRCHRELTDEQKARFQERQKQMELAKTRQMRHLGRDV